ncbi:hypothetical protein HPB49_007855 [Dermacentor silvarum]|uniref:Uncharacterized protein n=1 Tax=Dermacentor silvarum TaxID=543639 RepID=A0ACB8C872_DERSI|nr:hypothetical protein HPB49_007855 [Dermacentor silvarum]
MDVIEVEGEDITPQVMQDLGCIAAHEKRHRSGKLNNDQVERQAKKPAITAQSKSDVRIRQPPTAPKKPQLPRDDFKIVIRPRGGFDAARLHTVVVRDGVLLGADLTHEAPRDGWTCAPIQTTRNAVYVAYRTQRKNTNVHRAANYAASNTSRETRQCTEIFKTPYLLKKRQWERTQQEQQRLSAEDRTSRSRERPNHNSTDAGGNDRAGGSSRSRSRSYPRLPQGGGSGEIITDIDKWTQQIHKAVKQATREITKEAGLEAASTKLLHLSETLGSLQRWWRRQRLNRTLRWRIARLDRKIEDHANRLNRLQWESTCNSMEGELGLGKTWNFL